VHKISIISRGQALGYTISMPQEDRFLTTRAELLDGMAMTLGGRAAEEIVFSEITTGASNDLEKVTATAKQMVMRFGMSERLAARLRPRPRPAVPGPRVLRRADYSTRSRARSTTRSAACRGRAPACKDILAERRDALEKISHILLKRETIEKEEFAQLLEGKTEEEVFGAEESEPPPLRLATPERVGREAPLPLPRPASPAPRPRARLPEKPELA